MIIQNFNFLKQNTICLHRLMQILMETLEINCSFLFSHLDIVKIFTAFTKIKTSNGLGSDMISSFFLKTGTDILPPPPSAAVQLAPFLLDTFLITGRSHWLGLSSNKGDKSNYRPISVFPVASRLFEKLVFDQLYSYFNDNISGQSRF